VFLREGRALYYNLYPSRIIASERSARADVFAHLLLDGSCETNMLILYTDMREAEASKLLANTYLSMQVAFFNELNNYALRRNMDFHQIIEDIHVSALITTIRSLDIEAIACLRFQYNYWPITIKCRKI
jgi:UDPglucose 6-dehydrogenase